MTEPLTEAQKTVLDHQKREYDIKFKTWAIDRAIEILKIAGDKPQIKGQFVDSGTVDLMKDGDVISVKSAPWTEKLQANAETVIDQAEKLCAWITSSPKEFAVPSADEAETMAEHLKHTGVVQ